jgi:hypothetical protein
MVMIRKQWNISTKCYATIPVCRFETSYIGYLAGICCMMVSATTSNPVEIGVNWKFGLSREMVVRFRVHKLEND